MWILPCQTTSAFPGFKSGFSVSKAWLVHSTSFHIVWYFSYCLSRLSNQPRFEMRVSFSRAGCHVWQTSAFPGLNQGFLSPRLGWFRARPSALSDATPREVFCRPPPGGHAPLCCLTSVKKHQPNEMKPFSLISGTVGCDSTFVCSAFYLADTGPLYIFRLVSF